MLLKVLSALLLSSTVFAATPECRDELGGGDAQVISYREEVCRLVNIARAKNGLPPLRLDSRLSKVAQSHADDMWKQGYFSHQNPLGESSFDRMAKEGITYRAAGENIAKGQPDPKAVLTSWMNSPGHRANILSSKFGKLGVGFREAHWVQDFTN